MGRSGKKRSRKKEQPSPQPVTFASSVPYRPWLPDWVQFGVVPFFLIACAFGVLEVHSSTDTWIGLMAGRDILTQDTFPMTDSWSFVFEGKTWFNQNWLTHVYLWVLYDWFGPDATIYGTWAIAAAIFVFSGLATWFRTGSWFAAVLAGALVGIASRDWLSARPATAQFFLMSLLWMTITALMMQRPGKQRWWAVALLFLAFAAWPHAHGSFIFGYGLLGMYMGVEFLAFVFKGRPGVSWTQWFTVAGIALVTALMGFLLSPYGIDNYIHPFVVAESDVFRTVGEWRSPFVHANWPPVERFWAMFALAAASPVILGILWIIDLATADKNARAEAPRAKQTSWRWQVILLDVASVMLGLAMAFWARRFAPIFYILATPVLFAAMMTAARWLTPRTRRHAREIIALLTWPAAVAALYFTVIWAQRDFGHRYPPWAQPTLLDRVARADTLPRSITEFLRRNELKPKLFTEWTVAAPVVFDAPGTQIFIDGRSQQVYDEKHYMAYMHFLAFPDSAAATIGDTLASYGTEGALLRAAVSIRRLLRALEQDPDWGRVFASESGILLVRKDSDFWKEIFRREQMNELWWPDTPFAEASRGMLHAMFTPPDVDFALTAWKSAAQRNPEVGARYHRAMVSAWRQTGRVVEGLEFLRSERTRLESDRAGLDAETHKRVLDSLTQYERALQGLMQRGGAGG